ncbi:MAG: membrane protein insertion efficiency factor YidD [Planctomyces sp.]|jgi:hypothetical protein
MCDGHQPHQSESDATKQNDWEFRKRRWLRPVEELLILPVRLYQITLSPLLGRKCRFYPSCSQYFVLAVRRYGPVRGLWKALLRICRCHPLHPGGYDPP